MNTKQIIVVETIILNQNPMDKISKHLEKGWVIKQISTSIKENTVVLTMLLEKDKE